MFKTFRFMALAAAIAALSACGEKKEAVDVQKVMQEGIKKEQKMMEGMTKNAEELMKKTEEKQETKK